MVDTKIVADQGADADFIPVPLLEAIINKELFIVPKNLRPCQIYCNVAGELCFTCHRLAKLDVFLHIGQGTSLVQSNIIWKVSEEEL